jgi:CubicO group peptidase (beta-lactamase class C family)
MTETQGWTAPGWEGVRDVFVANFASGGEVGAAFSAYHRGEKVVDLWGGVADQATGRAWDEDAIVPVFSTTKGATAICAHTLAEAGRLDVDAPVTTYWPEFGQAGKEAMPVSYLLAHRAGLAWVDGTMSLEDALAWEPVIRALEVQAPAWEPGTKHGYHATTYGWLVGEVVKRIAGRSLGTYFRDEVAGPLGLDFWIGLPESEEPRTAMLIPSGFGETSEDAGADEDLDPEIAKAKAENAEQLRELIRSIMGPDTMLGKALYAPGGALAAPDVWNTREVHAAEIPAANGVCDARSLAKLYAACVSEVDGVRILGPAQAKAATQQQTEGPDVVLMDMDLQFGLGFMLHAGMVPLGGPGSFGHFGMGGSVGWADPETELAMGYVMNRMDMGMAGDTRSYNLIAACYDALT